MSETQTPRMDALIERIIKLLPRRTFKKSGKEGIDIAELVEYTKKPYRQIYGWIVERKSIPNGEDTLRFQQWCNRKEAISDWIAVNPNANIPTSGETSCKAVNS